MTKNLYARYDEWKGWGEEQFMVLSDLERAYFDAEFSGITVHGKKVLEIGFGSGSLLAWLRDQGAELYGTELSSQGKLLAAQQNVEILDVDLSRAYELKGQFGAVAAFDVLEHLTYSEIVSLLDKAATLLRPGGFFIARFPNGASPFGRAHQHEDITHVSTLTPGKIVQLMLDKPFDMQRAGPTALPPHGGFVVRTGKRVRGVLRKTFERGVSALYGYPIPFSFNVIVVLRRRADDAFAAPL